MSARSRAADALVFYLRNAREAAGLGWSGDNNSEVREPCCSCCEG
jgi:hypothetical protein